jgi:Ohr subfamily peroxiredoxin
MPGKVLYTAEATSTGDGRSGHVTSSGHRLDLDLAPPAEMGGDGNGTNPEQLFAAGYSACFHTTPCESWPAGPKWIRATPP